MSRAAATAKTVQRNALKTTTNKSRWNPKKYLSNPQEGKRRERNVKQRKQTRMIKWHKSSPRSINVLNIVGQNTVFKIQRLVEWIKKHHVIVYFDKKPASNEMI